ncbi:dihydroxyacetone kinase family protein [Brevibacterium sp. 50QC2O2]|jgi:dihydroxyacetone kinase|uniref:dihydroxyacetone kinase family protein n=1 Tax=Brevibacterium sp. 50QC2O2 TaxID=2968459 RepID=UPI00211C24FA|nr:dihydroxyacetone kinase family protein [Brevibacterium sp. 50QC2O2]MCQ9388201.1 dihydroxyacetone kinase family protein [Brevibacterium sp. 50QC2O2]
MTYLFNDPDDFAAQAVAGLVAANPDLTQVHGGVVRSTRTPAGQPALVVGGGSGHYPAFAGWVGPGMAHGAPCGNVFASPSASQVYSVARNAEAGGGVILGFGNYAGDILHFGLAAEKLRAEGIDVRIVPVADDIVSNTEDKHRERRGIAGDLPVFKITGAAIEAGANLDEAERIAWKANDATRSFGVAFAGCTLPGAPEPLFTVQPGQMAVGLGIHGEPGIHDEDLGSAADVARLLLEGILAEEPERAADGYNGRVAVVLNGLGTVKYEELFVLYAALAPLLAEHGLTPVAQEVGEFVTSLDMAGASLTLVFLDDELEELWTAPTCTPAFRRGSVTSAPCEPRDEIWTPEAEAVPPADAASRTTAAGITEVLDLFSEVCLREEDELGRLDAIAGDGDHGMGMVHGSRAAALAAHAATGQGAGARTVLLRAGAAWAEGAGGTSGALWGAALTAAGGVYSDERAGDDATLLSALAAGVDAICRLGGAKPGDKTMVDAALPFRDTLAADSSGSAARAIVAGAEAATAAAAATADITARLGRARVLGEKSVGTPDPGALSFAILMTELGARLNHH